MTSNNRAVEVTSLEGLKSQPENELANIVDGFAGANLGLIALSSDCKISFVNEAFIATCGLADSEPGTFIGKHFAEVFAGCSLPTHASPRSEAVTEAASKVSRKPISVLWSSNAVGGWIGVVTTTHSSTNSSALLFEPDELTGLATRKHLKAHFHRMVDDADQIDPSLVVLFLDLDHFKQVNDTLGHSVGDGLLCKVAERLKKTVRKEDLVVRIGGDEFAILLSDRNPSESEDVASRIIGMLGRPFLVDGHQITIGVSVGLATRAPNESDPDGMLQRADIALYESKRSGRNRFNWFKDKMLDELEKRREIEIDLRRAVLLDQFRVLFQPQMSFEDQRVSGFEALIRWDHPTHGEIGPVGFIGVAEETGLIIDIGAWVLSEACKTAIAWPDGLAIAVNVSPVQFEDKNFVASVKSALAASGLQPDRLELEITETTLLKNEELVLERMNDLRALGVKISLDDFGIGYSSLNYLRKYPFDKVKIDQSFVREPFADDSAHQIVEAVAQLGTAFGMHVLAEGVETTDQLARIRGKGCDSIQGYLLGRPIKSQDIGSFLQMPLPKISTPQSSSKEGTKR